MKTTVLPESLMKLMKTNEWYGSSYNADPPWKEKYMGSRTLHKDLTGYTTLIDDHYLKRPIPLLEWCDVIMNNLNFIMNDIKFEERGLDTVIRSFICDLCGATITGFTEIEFNPSNPETDKYAYNHMNYKHLIPFISYKLTHLKIYHLNNDSLGEMQWTEDKTQVNPDKDKEMVYATMVNRARSVYDLNVALWFIVVEEGWQEEFKLWCIAKALNG